MFCKSTGPDFTAERASSRVPSLLAASNASKVYNMRNETLNILRGGQDKGVALELWCYLFSLSNRRGENDAI
eukprot:2727918-Amphidinium_carterae.1